MSRVHLGMKRPIRQFTKSWHKLLFTIEEIKQCPPTSELEKSLYKARIKQNVNDCLIQLNNIKNTQIEYLEKEEVNKYEKD